MRLKLVAALACAVAFAAGPAGAEPCGRDWRPEFARHGFDVRALTENYMQRQNTEIPVHEWDIHA